MSFLDDLAEIAGYAEAVGSQLEEAKDSVIGLALKAHHEKKKADALKETIDRTNQLGEKEKKPSPLGVAFEVGRFLLNRR